MKCKKITAKGRVQGVGFRYYTLNLASIFNIKGYVKNRYYDQVEIIACGSDTDLIAFAEEIKKGPPHARVEDIQISEIITSKDYENFSIKY